LGTRSPQGTVDSNEIWAECLGDRCQDGANRPQRRARDVQARSIPWSHFINVYMLDKDGNRIDRRNAQDIFTPLYNNQIPPGAAHVLHYKLTVPETADRAR
jgi:hypothetical protein